MFWKWGEKMWGLGTGVLLIVTVVCVAPFVAGCGAPTTPDLENPEEETVWSEDGGGPPADLGEKIAASLAEKLGDLGPPRFFAEEIPDLVATVGELQIRRKDYLKEIQNVMRRIIARAVLDEKATGRRTDLPSLTARQRQDILDSFVAKRVMLVLALDAGVKGTDADIQGEVDVQMEKMRSQANFEGFLRDQDLVEGEIAAQFKRDLIRKKFWELHRADCVVSEEEVAAEYEVERAKGAMAHGDEVDYWQLVVAVPAGAEKAASDTAEAEARAALDRIVAGEDFAEVAREVSEAPDVVMNDGFVPRMEVAELPPEFRSILAELPVGVVGEPVRTRFGWHVFRVDARREAGVLSLEDASERLRDILLNRCTRDRIDALVAQAHKELPVKVFYRAVPE